jgi:hypothetical protein
MQSRESGTTRGGASGYCVTLLMGGGGNTSSRQTFLTSQYHGILLISLRVAFGSYLLCEWASREHAS